MIATVSAKGKGICVLLDCAPENDHTKQHLHIMGQSEGCALHQPVGGGHEGGQATWGVPWAQPGHTLRMHPPLHMRAASGSADSLYPCMHALPVQH